MKPINWQRLTDFFDAEDIEWKPVTVSKKTGKALAAAYITARAIQERLDEVFGVGGWKNEYRAGPDGGVICRIYFRNEEGDWVWREDGAENTDIESVKGGLSGALKRAGSALGIGRYLYKLPQVWAPVDDYGKFKQAPSIPRQFLPPTAPRTTDTGGNEATDQPRPGITNDYPAAGELTARDLYSIGRRKGFTKSQIEQSALSRYERPPEQMTLAQLEEAIEALSEKPDAIPEETP